MPASRKISVKRTLVLSLLHLLALTGLIGITSWQSQTLVFALVLYLLNSLSVFAGLHALWSHRSFKTNKFFEAFHMFFSTMGHTGSVFWWARDHRIHHAFQDTSKDPHNINDGFWYAHIGWLLMEKTPEQLAAHKQIYLEDLTSNKLLMWQHKHYGKIWFPIALGLPTLICGLGWGDYLGGFLFAGAFRMMFFLNCVFGINSIAHTFGRKDYAGDIKAVDNFLLSLAMVGAGNHNYHHKYPSDYRSAPDLKGFNPGAWYIWALAKMGIVWDLKVSGAARKSPLVPMFKPRDAEVKVTTVDNVA